MDRGDGAGFILGEEEERGEGGDVWQHVEELAGEGGAGGGEVGLQAIEEAKGGDREGEEGDVPAGEDDQGEDEEALAGGHVELEGVVAHGGEICPGEAREAPANRRMAVRARRTRMPAASAASGLSPRGRMVRPRRVRSKR